MLKNVTYEVYDVLIIHLKVRFGDFESVQFIELLDGNHFIVY